MADVNSDDLTPLQDPEDAEIVSSNNNSDDLTVPMVGVVGPINETAAATETSIVALLRATTWRQRATVLVATFVDFTAMCCMSVMAPFLPLEAGQKGINGTTVGLIFACFELVMFFGSIITGRYLTAIGARFAYIAGALVAASCSVLFGFLEWCPPGITFAVMCISCRVVEAFGCAACETSSTAIVANEFPNHVATVFGFIESIAGLGLMVGPLIGGVLYDLGGFFLPFLAVGVGFFIAGIVASFSLPPTIIPAPKDTSQMFRKFITLPAVIVCGICIFTCAIILTFSDPILANRLAAIDSTLAHSQTLIGLVFFVMPALYVLLSPFVGYLADTFRHQLPLLVLGNVGFMISFILIGPCPLLPIIPSKQLWPTIVALVIMGLSCGFSFMPAFAVINRACKAAGLTDDLDLFGFIAGFFGFTFNLGAFTGPLLSAVLVDQLSFEWATSLMALVPSIDILAIIIFAIISRQPTRDGTS